jgi:hypothetical protein
LIAMIAMQSLLAYDVGFARGSHQWPALPSGSSTTS